MLGCIFIKRKTMQYIGRIQTLMHNLQKSIQEVLSNQN